MSLKVIKQKIRAVKKIRQVTRAMEAVSAVKMRRSQATAIEARPYAFHAMSIFKRIAAKGVLSGHPLLEHREQEQHIALVVITSDRGLAGSLNSYVLRRAHRLIEEHGWSKEQVSILAIGRKGYEHFSRRGFTIIDRLERWGEGVSLGDPDRIAHALIEGFLQGTYDRVVLIYSNFNSTFSQEPVARRMLPVSSGALNDVLVGIIPDRGKYSELRSEIATDVPHEYLFEPHAHAVLDELIPHLLSVMLYHGVLENNASEHSARMVAMKSASDRARDVAKDMTLLYNKERQTSITAEVSEITSGIEAMK